MMYPQIFLYLTILIYVETKLAVHPVIMSGDVLFKLIHFSTHIFYLRYIYSKHVHKYYSAIC